MLIPDPVSPFCGALIGSTYGTLFGRMSKLWKHAGDEQKEALLTVGTCLTFIAGGLVIVAKNMK
jgi:hypothetical protein